MKTIILMLMINTAFAQPAIQVRGGLGLGTHSGKYATEMNMNVNYKIADIGGGVAHNKYGYALFATGGIRYEVLDSWYISAFAGQEWATLASKEKIETLLYGGAIEKHIHSGIVFIKGSNTGIMVGVKYTYYRD